MDSTIIAMSVTVTAAISAPLITAIIQGRNSRELRKTELLYSEKLAAYKDFIAAFSEVRDNNGISLGSWRKFNSAANLARLYGNAEFNAAVQLLLLMADKGDKSAIDKTYNDCIQALFNEMLEAQPKNAHAKALNARSHKP